jgi:hypothetical protein
MMVMVRKFVTSFQWENADNYSGKENFTAMSRFRLMLCLYFDFFMSKEDWR